MTTESHDVEQERRSQGVARSARQSSTGTVAVACESTACVPADLVRRYDIGVVPVPLVFGTQTFLDGVDPVPSELYATLAALRAIPTTSPPTPGAYLDAWGRLAARGDTLALVTMAGGVSTFQRSITLAQELAEERLLGMRVAVVDSGSAAMGQGFVALAAARAAAAGQTLEEVVRAAEEVRRRVQMVVMLDTLEYLALAARIPHITALLGGVLAIKPIILFDQGAVHQLARVRTRRRAIEQLLEQLRQRVPAAGRLHVAVHHTQAETEARELAARIGAAFACAELLTTEFTPVMGAYCGPGLLAIAFYAEEPEEGERATEDTKED
jgi:DegV family protein with EDD domain